MRSWQLPMAFITCLTAARLRWAARQGVAYCGESFSDGSYSGDAGGFGGAESSGSGESGGDSSDGGSGCGGGCGGGGD
jgi:hypothetical protein